VTAAPAPLIDAVGTLHAPAGPAPRIACLVPSLTELLIDLGLGDRLVARTRFCIHPANAVAGIPAVGGTKKVNLEKLRALAPTHAVLNVEENTAEMAAALREFVPHIIVTYPKRPEDNRALFWLMGELFHCRAAASDLARRFEDALARLGRNAAGLPPRRVLYLVWKEPWMTVSSGTYIAATLAELNWHPAVDVPGTAYPEVTITPELLARVDRVLFSSEPYAFGPADVEEFARRYDCPAAKLALIDGEYCSWYGSRAVKAMDYLAALAAELTFQGGENG
jgi:ABC-type Fe3+-hydroxamate transport system substrate-binding protein